MGEVYGYCRIFPGEAGSSEQAAVMREMQVEEAQIQEASYSSQAGRSPVYPEFKRSWGQLSGDPEAVGSADKDETDRYFAAGDAPCGYQAWKTAVWQPDCRYCAGSAGLCVRCREGCAQAQAAGGDREGEAGGKKIWQEPPAGAGQFLFGVPQMGFQGAERGGSGKAVRLFTGNVLPQGEGSRAGRQGAEWSLAFMNTEGEKLAEWER